MPFSVDTREDAVVVRAALDARACAWLTLLAVADALAAGWVRWERFDIALLHSLSHAVRRSRAARRRSFWREAPPPRPGRRLLRGRLQACASQPLSPLPPPLTVQQGPDTRIGACGEPRWREP